MKKNSTFAFIAAAILTLVVSFLVFVVVLRTVDVNTWLGVGIGETLLWLNAWAISRRKKKWPYKLETSQQ